MKPIVSMLAALLVAAPASAQVPNPRYEFKTGGRSVRAMEFSPDGKWLAIVSAKERRASWLDGIGTAAVVVVSPSTAPVTYSDYQLTLWDIAGRRRNAEWQVDKDCRPQFSADGKLLAFGYKELKGARSRGRLLLIDYNGAKPAQSFATSWDQRSFGLNTALSRSGSRLVASHGENIHVWDLRDTDADPIVLRATESPQSSSVQVELSPDGKYIAVAIYDCSSIVSFAENSVIKVLDAATAKDVSVIAKGNLQFGRPRFLSDSTHLTYWTAEVVNGLGCVRMWRRDVMAVDRPMLLGEYSAFTASLDCKEKIEPMFDEILVREVETGSVLICKRANSRELATVRSSSKSSSIKISPSPDRRFLAIGSSDVKIWHVDDFLGSAKEK